MRHEIGSVDEFSRGKISTAVIDDVRVAVFRLPSGEFRALRDICPHKQARLSAGTLTRALAAELVGGYVLSDHYVVRCPYHGMEFDLESGRCLADPAGLGVRTYAIEVVDGKVVIAR